MARGAVLILFVFLAVACGGNGDEASVSIASPEDGSSVESPVEVQMEASGFGIEPAGAVRDGAGHFHVVVDGACLPPGDPIPQDATHHHFVDGSSDAALSLEPGEHTLCLQAGDGAHTALDLTDEVTFTVTESGGGSTTGSGEAGAAELWRGTVTGTLTRSRCSPEAVALTGEVELRVRSDGGVTGSTVERWGSCSVAGTVVPAQENRYRIRGRKMETVFELTVTGTGVRRVTVPIRGTRAGNTFTEGTGGYRAEITYILKCVNCPPSGG
jgi:hypothetical protein